MLANKLKKILISCVLLISAFLAFAGDDIKTGYTPNKKVGKNRIYITGRITVKTDMNMTDVATRRNVEETQLGKPDVYSLASVDGDDFENHLYKNGDYFVIDYDLSELKSLYNKDSKEVYFCTKELYLPFYFFSSAKMKINLPNNLCFTINDEDCYYYIGDIEYIYKGRYFELKDIKILDKYEEAQKNFNQLLPGNNGKLSRAELRTYKLK